MLKRVEKINTTILHIIIVRLSKNETLKQVQGDIPMFYYKLRSKFKMGITTL